MKQQDQCVESWWAIRIGRHDDYSVPYFMRTSHSGVVLPMLFPSRTMAKSQCPELGRVVRVVLTTTGETQ